MAYENCCSISPVSGATLKPNHYARNLLLPEIATALGVSKRHLTRIVRQELGTSPKELLNRYRIQ